VNNGKDIVSGHGGLFPISTELSVMDEVRVHVAAQPCMRPTGAPHRQFQRVLPAQVRVGDQVFLDPRQRVMLAVVRQNTSSLMSETM
jgi:hypothetical protein